MTNRNASDTNGADHGQFHDQRIEDQDDDNVTVIVLENNADDEVMAHGWVDQDSPEMQERRRNVLLRELQRVQRASFIHFMIFFMVVDALALKCHNFGCGRLQQKVA